MRIIQATENDLIRRFANLPIDKIKLSYLKHSSQDIQMADIVTITIKNDSRALKSRYGMSTTDLKILGWLDNAT